MDTAQPQGPQSDRRAPSRPVAHASQASVAASVGASAQATVPYPAFDPAPRPLGTSCSQASAAGAHRAGHASASGPGSAAQPAARGSPDAALRPPLRQLAPRLQAAAASPRPPGKAEEAAGLCRPAAGAPPDADGTPVSAGKRGPDTNPGLNPEPNPLRVVAAANCPALVAIVKARLLAADWPARGIGKVMSDALGQLSATGLTADAWVARTEALLAEAAAGP